MKTRHGFVSNSSSSSFILVFDKEPLTVEDALDFLFGNHENPDEISPVPIPYSDSDCFFTKREIAEALLHGIKPIDKSSIINDLQHRYYFTDNYEGGVQAYYDMGDKETFCGLNSDLVEEIKDLYIESNKLSKECWKLRQSLQEGLRLIKVPYAYEGGLKEDNKTRYTKKEIEAYQKYRMALDQVEKFPEMVKLHQTQTDIQNKIDKLSEKLAEFDYKKFEKANSGKFFFETSFSDNDGEFGSYMEHSGVLEVKGKCIRLSHH
jgi:hypothetical protein